MLLERNDTEDQNGHLPKKKNKHQLKLDIMLKRINEKLK